MIDIQKQCPIYTYQDERRHMSLHKGQNKKVTSIQEKKIMFKAHKETYVFFWGKICMSPSKIKSVVELYSIISPSYKMLTDVCSLADFVWP